VQLGRLGHVVRPQGRGQHLGNHASTYVQQCQPMRRGKTTSRLLLARLSEVGLELVRIGHRETRTIGVEHTVSEPTPGVERILLQLLHAAPQQQAERFQFETHPRSAISGRRE